MSNFISHLVQRALSPAPSTVQPRLASRFENAVAPARQPEAQADGFSPSPGVSTQAPSAVARTPERVKALPPMAALAAPPTTPSSATPAPSPSSPVPVIARHHPLATPSSLPSPPAPAPVPAPRAAASTGALEQLVELQPSTHTLLVEHVTERVREIHLPSTASLSVAPPNPAPEHLIVPAALPAPVSHKVPPTPAPLPILPPAAIAQTTIRVNIGRIDIRAVHTTPSAPAPRQAPVRRPLVSLEDYLKQRAAS